MRAVRKLADVVLVLDVPAPAEPGVLDDIDRVVNMVERALNSRQAGRRAQWAQQAAVSARRRR